MKAVVNVPICPLTVQPGPHSERADEVLLGMTAEVLERAGENLVRVRTAYRYEGYAPSDALLTGEAAERWEALPKQVVLHKSFCDVLAGPRYQERVLLNLPRGALLAPLGEPEEGWQRVRLPDGREGFARAGILGEYRQQLPELPEDALRKLLCDTALLYRGTPYRWGGKTPAGIDCSGLVSMAYLLCGAAIFRDAKLMPDFPVREIPRERMAPGDLLYFPGHVAMYLGEERYCHCTGKAGEDGFAVNSLDPAAPDFRADLAQSLYAVGSIF